MVRKAAKLSIPSRSGIITSSVTSLGLRSLKSAKALRGGLGFALDMEAELGQMMADDFPRERRIIYYQRWYGHG